ncbi:hypothetical protein POM88_001368 [Heracleum sosnowskyi]|uniref:Uncharacterized protein n=1 Tax=Heracleum sosnowskyi TaxID=360622 RepID=A0AAD8NBN2_9APIA|nr:hypothetical protein POM88_001368 [Heracleum sosnowskyi]
MSDEEHQFESKADAGASKKYPQQAGTSRKGGYIVIKGRACKCKSSLSSVVHFLQGLTLHGLTTKDYPSNDVAGSSTVGLPDESISCMLLPCHMLEPFIGCNFICRLVKF